MYRLTLELTDGQRAELERARARDPRAYLRERAAALLRVAGGASPHAVAAGGLGLLKPRDPDTVYGWLGRYRAGGLPALAHLPRGRRGLSPSGRGRGGGGGAPGPRGARARPAAVAAG